MRAAVPVLLLIGCGGAPAPTASPANTTPTATADPLRLTAVPRAVGDRFDETSHDFYDVMVEGVHIVEVQDYRCAREVRARWSTAR